MDVIVYQTEQEALDAIEIANHQICLLQKNETNFLQESTSRLFDLRDIALKYGWRKWDTVREHPFGGWYFASPKQKYSEHFDTIVTGNFLESFLETQEDDPEEEI